MVTVLVFGTFDLLHAGHLAFLSQAAALGDRLLVVAARDSYIEHVKQRAPRISADDRRILLEAEPAVGEVVWGDEWPTAEPYRLLRDLNFDVLALGYDQEPADSVVQDLLRIYHKENIRVVRLPPFRPEVYKSSLLV